MENMPAVIFVTIVGTAIGIALHFQKAITKGCTVMERGISKVFPRKETGITDVEQ